MSAVRYLPVADDDLLAAWLFIASDNPAAADEYIDRIHHVCALIADNPAMGAERAELRAGLRCFPVDNHVVFYTAHDWGITVLRIWPAAQDPATIELRGA